MANATYYLTDEMVKELFIEALDLLLQQSIETDS